MIKATLQTFVLCWFTISLLAAPCAYANSNVQTDSGPIIGLPADEHGVRKFLGVPYAQAPIGELRWTHAQRPQPWDEPLVTQEYALASAQPKPRPYQGIGDRGEDSLYLNVFAPKADATTKSPVMIWIHGGGFSSGTAMSDNYDASVLAREGLCVVVPNYRLGPLGFFAHPALSKEQDGISGNQALSDILLLLQWVQNNAEAFGGDPDNVTIAGQSAGGVAVASLMCMPKAQGLFHRAIIQSGGATANLPVLRNNSESISAEDFGLLVAQNLGIEGSDKVALEQLRQVSTDDLLSAWSEVSSTHGRMDICIDDHYLHESLWDMFEEGRQSDVSVLVGITGDEGSMFLMRTKAKTLEEYNLWLEERFGDLAANARSLYPASTVEEAQRAQIDCVTDRYDMHARHIARSVSKTSNLWLYRFTRVSPFGKQMRLGSYHGAEVAYVFGRVESGKNYTQDDAELSQKIRTHWINFCTNGNPNDLSLTAWPMYSADLPQQIVFDTESRIEQPSRTQQLDYLEQLDK